MTPFLANQSLRGLPAYAAALAIVLLVVALRWAFAPLLGTQAPFLVLLVAPVLAAAWGGFGPGLSATVLCAALGQLLFVIPDGTRTPSMFGEWVRLAVFVTEGALFSWLLHVRRTALDEIRRREQRLVDALETAPSAMLIVGRSGSVVFANARAREWFGYGATEFARLTVEDLLPERYRDTHRADRETFARAPVTRAMGESRDLYARRRDGSEFPVEVGLSALQHGDDGAVLAAIVDLTTRQAEQRRLQFLLGLTESLQTLRDPAAMIDAATAALGRHLGVAQVGYGEIDAAQEHVIVERDWNDGQIPSVVGTWRMNDFGPQFIREMQAGVTIVIPDVTLDPRTNSPEVVAAYEGIRTRSILDVPLIRDGRQVSMIFIHHPQPRAWTPDDVLAAEETCARLWSAVERVRAEARARLSLALLDRAGAAARVGAFVDTLDGPDSLRWSDRLFEIFGVEKGRQPPRARAFDVFPPAFRGVLRDALERMQANGLPVEIELPLLPGPGRAEWVRLYVVPTLRDGRCVEISGAVQDIGDRKRLEFDVVNARDHERARIGEDLHDDLGQVLTAVSMQVGALRHTLLRQEPTSPLMPLVQSIDATLDRGRDACRRLAKTYVAPVTAASFRPMLEQLARDVAGTVRCTVDADDLPSTMPPATAQELYRIVQEAVNNALKHSRCKTLTIRVLVGDEQISLTVADDGIGLPDVSRSTGVGLSSIRNRAARLGGVATIGPGTPGGTRVTVTCAYADREARVPAMH